MSVERRGQQNLNLTKGIRGTFKGKVSGAQGSLFKDMKGVLSWDVRVGLKALDKTCVFTNLMKHVNFDTLHEAFRAMDGNKALGVDKISKSEYGLNLKANLENLADRIKRGTYRPGPKREVLIPKANGKKRPIAIASFEDKLVDWCVARILIQVYEPLFIENSFGYRPIKSAEGAIRTLHRAISEDKLDQVVEIDFTNFFNTIPHDKLMRIVEKRIADKRFLTLIRNLLKGGILNSNQQLVPNELGTPQGGIASPVLANIYLNEVVDQWFTKKYGARGRMVRYADDAVFFFRNKEDAETFQDELKTRIEEYGLKLNEEKTRRVDMSKGRNGSLDFLGFSIHWKKKSKQLKLCVSTQKVKHLKAIQAFYDWVRGCRNKMDTETIWKLAKARIKGYVNYYGFATNYSRVMHYLSMAIKALYKWLNRRSQKRSYTWGGMMDRLVEFPLISLARNINWKELGGNYGRI
jgi:group II intron reverse transcriptase/maturase